MTGVEVLLNIKQSLLLKLFGSVSIILGRPQFSKFTVVDQHVRIMEAEFDGTSARMEKRKELKKQFSRMARTPPVDIEFQDLTYSVRDGGFRGEHKQILKSLSGNFCAGELTAILGPSGSGKTTLLNILAGYVLGGVTGSIKVNGRPRQMKAFHKRSAYLMQEDLLPQLMTVEELMMVAAKLKLGDEISLQQKEKTVKEVTTLLGLETCLKTRTEHISGGQRKRLAIALELVNNPPVIFLDEPTSGLDTVAIKQCIEVLQILTNQGRTVICTIHQPSDSVFQQFDQVYFISSGMCIYNGSTPDLVPFLSSIGLPCPITYSPADYVIEVVHTNQECFPDLVTATQNGKINRMNRSPHELSKRALMANVTSDIYEDTTTESKVNFNFPTSFWTQFYILYSRMMLQFSRNKLVIAIQLFHHTLSGMLLGILFFGIGNNAVMAFASFKFCVSVMVFFVYTYLMTPVLIFPSEIKILKREYFNRWYSLKAYFLALTLQNLPLLTILGMSFTLITYLMTSQPLELYRFILFAFAGVLVALATEGMGIAIGSVCNITNGSVVGAAIAGTCLALGIYGMGYGTAIEPTMKVFMSFSYLRYALVAFCQAVFGSRPPFDCHEHDVYCHYKEPKHLLRDLGMLDSSYSFNMMGLCCFVLLFRLIAYFAIRYRLTSEFSHTVVNYANKIFRHK